MVRRGLFAVSLTAGLLLGAGPASAETSWWMGQPDTAAWEGDSSASAMTEWYLATSAPAAPADGSDSMPGAWEPTGATGCDDQAPIDEFMRKRYLAACGMESTGGEETTTAGETSDVPQVGAPETEMETGDPGAGDETQDDEGYDDGRRIIRKR
jgi:hypothetical protein